MKVREFTKAYGNPKLEGLKVRTPKAVVGYIFSLGNCIVFLNNTYDRPLNDGRLYPQIVAKDEDIQNWDIVSDEVACNCDVLVQHKYIMNE